MTRYFRASATIAIVATFALVTFTQSRVSTADKFIISAKAGAVNVVMGDVTVERENGRTSRLFKGDELQIGEKVSTGVDGKAEILMNPGSYIRLGANSAFVFDSTDLDDVRVKMDKGSAVFEVFGAEEFTVDVKAGTSRFAFVETGIYRVDVAADGNADVSIVKGKVLPGLDAKKAIKSGKTLDYSGNTFAVVKYDKDSKDDLDVWSSERAKQLSLVAKSLRPDRLRDPLISAFGSNRWNLYNSYGLWVYDPFFRSFCFLPFGYGWNSPYGFGFGRPLWYYNMPTWIYNAPPPSNPGNSPIKIRNDRGFADAVKTRDNTRKTSSDGDIFVRQPTKVRVEPPVYNAPTKMPSIEAAPPIFSAPSNAPTKRP